MLIAALLFAGGATLGDLSAGPTRGADADEKAHHAVPAGLDEVQAIREIERIAGKVLRDEKMPGRPVVSVDLTGRRLRHVLPAISCLRSLRVLNLAATDITEADLAELRGLDNLEQLDLAGLQITDAGISEIIRHRRLTSLDLSSTQVGDFRIQRLWQLPNLTTIRLCGSRITDSDLQGIGALDKLSVLELSDNGITDQALRELVRLKSLRTLDLSYTKITDHGLRDSAEPEEPDDPQSRQSPTDRSWPDRAGRARESHGARPERQRQDHRCGIDASEGADESPHAWVEEHRRYGCRCQGFARVPESQVTRPERYEAH